MDITEIVYTFCCIAVLIIIYFTALYIFSPQEKEEGKIVNLGNNQKFRRELNIINQKSEDHKFKMAIDKAAELWYQEHITNPVWIRNGERFRNCSIFIPKFDHVIYTLYDEQTARYKNVSSFTTLIYERYQQLIAERGDPNLNTDPVAMNMDTLTAGLQPKE